MDSSNSGYSGRRARRASAGSSGASRDAGAQLVNPQEQRRAFRRLQTRQQNLPLVITTTALTLLVVIAVSYVAMRANAMSSAEASARTNAQIAREVISERGQYPALVNKQLVATSGTGNYPLVDDTWVVDHVRQLTGSLSVIYQLTEAPSLISVAADIPQTDGMGHAIANTRVTGQLMPSAAQTAIFGSCGAITNSSACPGDFAGTVTIGGVSYVAAFVPLLAQDGSVVGAVGALTPLDDVLAGPMQLVIMLLLLGLLAGLIALVAGMWLTGRFPNRLLSQLDSQLETMARAAIELQRLAHQQQYRLHYQQRTARQVGDHALRLEKLAATMDDGQAALHKTTTAIWEEMSQPGVAINAATALRLAREAAVRASEVGVAGDETRAHARQVITLMNRVIAEGRALAQEGQEAETHANELAATLDRMELDLGEQLAPHRYDLGSAPLIRRITGASHRLRQMFQTDEAPPAHPGRPITGRPPYRTGAPQPGMERPKVPSLPLGDSSGGMSSPSFQGNDASGGFLKGGQPGFQSPGNPGSSGNWRGGRRSPGESSPGGLPPLGWLDDDLPPRGPNDSQWLND